MPLRLALMAAIGALLALGACSSGTKTVTVQPTTTPTTPTPTPAPPDGMDDDDAPAMARLPDAAAARFTDPRVSFTVGEAPASADQTDTGVRTDRYGNRFRDVNGYRFVCEGGGACSWTILRDSDGMLSMTTIGDVRPGVVPSVKKLQDEGIEQYLEPASGDWQDFIVPAGGSRDLNLVRLACPAGGEACSVEIEIRGADRYLVESGGAIALSRAHMFYDGLAYWEDVPRRRQDDPRAFGRSMEQAIRVNFSSIVREGEGDDAWLTLSHHRAATADKDTLPSASAWGGENSIQQRVNVAPTAVSSGESDMKFAGFAESTSAENMAKTYGAVAVDRRLGLDVAASYDTANLPAAYNRPSMAWTVELPAAKTNGMFAFADADSRSSADRWSMGFTRTMRLGEDTGADMTDDGTLHLQVLTDYDTAVTMAPGMNFGYANEGDTIPGTVLIAPGGGAVPAAAPASQTVPDGNGAPGTFDGVPGVFACDGGNTCTVATSPAGVQTVSGGDLEFTPTTGALMIADDTDWLAIGSWAVAMDDGATAYGAFVDHGSDPFQSAANLLAARDEYTYDGRALGHYAEYADGDREAGVFAATARFVVDFDTASNPGDLYGVLRDFSTTAHGGTAAMERAAWRIDFASADSPYTLVPANDQHGFNPGATGKFGPGDDDTLTGYSWMRFYRPPPETGREFRAASGIGGTYAFTGTDADNKYNLTLIGAFGAKRP